MSNIPMSAAMQCPQCCKEAELKILKVDIPGEVATLISSLQCSHCLYRDNSIHDGDIGNGIGVFISCLFQTTDDLQRYIRLAEGSKVRIEKESAVFEFVCHVSGIYLVESIIREIIDNYEIHNNIDRAVPTEPHAFREEEVEESVETKREKGEKRVKLLNDILKNPQFLMTVSDNTGTSRVAPVGKMLRDVDGDEMEVFNDDRVRHASFKVDETEDK